MYAIEDLLKTDLLIVIGTSLAVSPFNLCVNYVGLKCPKVLINLENTAENGFDFENPSQYPERLLLKGKGDDIVKEIAKECGWLKDLEQR